MRNKFMSAMVGFLFIVLLNCGCGGSSSSSGGTTSGTGTTTITGTAGGVSQTVLGSGKGTVGVFWGNASASNPTGGKATSYSGGTVTKFEIEIKSITLKGSDVADAPFDVNQTIDIASPTYESAVNFLESLSVPAGNYSRIDFNVGTITFESTGISPDPKQTVEGYANTTISATLAFSVATDRELALPLTLDIDTILTEGFNMSATTPFAIKVTVLPLYGEGVEGAIWTTGDMLGFAGPMTDGVGDLYEIDDAGMITPVGTYSQLSDNATSGTYSFTGGTYAGIQGTFVHSNGGTFAGDSHGVFAINGNFSGGYWINDMGLYGTFTLTDGWIPNGTGTFQETDNYGYHVSGTITLNNAASGGAWAVTGGNVPGALSGDFSL